MKSVVEMCGCVTLGVALRVLVFGCGRLCCGGMNMASRERGWGRGRGMRMRMRERGHERIGI